ncbi:extracellular solute-binding protein [Actinomycetes bacterium KLBMP 9759]
MYAHRRALTAVVMLVLTALLATACGTGSGGGSGDGKVTLRIWDFSMEQVDFHKKVAEKYNQENPDVTIEWRAITQDEYKKTLPLAFQSRQAPDIFYWSESNMARQSLLLEQGWIAPLNGGEPLPQDVTSRWPAGSFIEGINTAEGKTYSFPFTENLFWGPGYMFMNNQVFQQAGLDPANPPKTWSELEATCAKIVAATEAECIAAPKKGNQFQRLWHALTGGTMSNLFFDYKNGRFSLDDPKMLETFAFIQKLEKAGYLTPGSIDQNFARQQFAANGAGIYMDGTWMPSVWATQGFTSDKYSVAAHPNPDAGPTGALVREPSQNVYWVSSQSAAPDAAWAFMEWMTRPDGFFVQEYYKNGFGTLAFADSKKLVTDPALKKIMEIAETPGFRANIPLPILKCPDIAKSKAYSEAASQRPDAEYEAMLQALADNSPLQPLAAGVVATRQKVFEDKLAAEQASGLKVSKDCYTFPDWDYRTDYGLDRYTG